MPHANPTDRDDVGRGLERSLAVQEPGARSLLLLCAIVMTAFVGHSMVAPLVPLLGASLGAGPVTVGLLIAISSVLPLFISVQIGSQVDHLGPRRLLLVGTALLGLGPLVVALGPGLAVLALAQVVIGFGQTCLAVASQTLAATFGTGRRRERAFGWYTTAVSVGQLVGPLGAGVIADRLGFGTAFAVAGAAAVAAFGLGLLVRPTPRVPLAAPTGSIGARLRNDIEHGRLLVGNVGMRMVLVVSLSLGFGWTAFQSFLPLYLDGLAYSATFVGFLISVRALTAVAVRPFLPSLVQWIGSRSRALAAMTVVVAMALMLVGFATGVVALVAITVLVGIGSGIAPPLAMVVVVEHVPPREQGFALGLRLSANRLAHIVSPLVVGALAEAIGLTGAFVAGGVLTLAGAAVLRRWSAPFEAADQSRRDGGRT